MTVETLRVDATLYDAIRLIEASKSRLAVVLELNSRRVAGTLTDGDVRRCFLQGGSLDTEVHRAMNKTPIVAGASQTHAQISALLKGNNIRALPLVSEEGEFLSVLHEYDLFANGKSTATKSGFSTAVIMAGGEGRRLRPHTLNIPKPMVDLGGRPLLERQLKELESIGVSRVFISINYLGDVIRDYFGDGAGIGIEIFYLEENMKLGTGGALSLLPSIDPAESILVMNGDILTTAQFYDLYEAHKASSASLTVGAINYETHIPYGVISHQDGTVKRVIEKPTQSYLCNAGIYAVGAQLLPIIPQDTFWNMTDLIEHCLQSNEQVSVFPIHEYWSDIGTPSDLSKARATMSLTP